MNGHLLADIGKAIIVSGLIGIPFYLMGIPLILAYIISGIILGPHLGFSLIQDPESISNISEIGLVLLLFILGLEINLKKIIQAGRAVLIGGSVQIIGSITLAGLFFTFLGYHELEFSIIYLSVACALSSTLIVVKILSDQMNLDSLPSRITLGILVLQDVAAIAFLGLQPSLSDLSPLSLIFSLSKVLILVCLSWVLARFILPTIFRKTSHQPELMLILSMAWCFGVCGIADYLHLSLEMGALVAGISIASFPYHLDVAAKISSLRDFFITLFFVSLGLQIPLPTADVFKLACLITVFVLVSRVITIFPVLHRIGYANRASLLPSLNLSQVSEFSLIIAAIGIADKHIPPYFLSAFILSLVGTALLSSFAIPKSHVIYKIINPFLIKLGFHDHVVSNDQVLHDQGRGVNSIVVLGFYREASSLIYEMTSKYSNEYLSQILVVDFNPEAHQELKKRTIHCQYGDISHVDTLRNLGLEFSKMIICTLPDKVLKGTTNLKLLRQIKKLAPNSCIIVTSDNIEYARELYKEGAHYVFIPRLISSTYLLEIIERLQVNGLDSIRGEAQKFLEGRNEIIA